MAVNSPPNVELFDVLTDPIYALAFREYADSTFSHENLSFWLEAEDFRHLSSAEMEVRAPEIWTKYFKPGSPDEVNVDAAIQLALRKLIVSGTFNARTFLVAQQYIWDLMQADTFPKFLKSEYWAKARQNRAKSQSYLNRLKRTFSSSNTKSLPAQSTSLEYIARFQKHQKKLSKKGASSLSSTYVPVLYSPSNLLTTGCRQRSIGSSSSSLLVAETSSSQSFFNTHTYPSSGSHHSLGREYASFIRVRSGSPTSESTELASPEFPTSRLSDSDSAGSDQACLWILSPHEIPLYSDDVLIQRTKLWSTYGASLRGHPAVIRKWSSSLSSNPELYLQFCERLPLLNRYQHPNVLQLKAAFTSDPSDVLLVHELVDRDASYIVEDPSSASHLLYAQRMTFLRNMDFLIQVALTLNYLHRNQPPFVVQDLNPRTVFLTHDFHVKLPIDNFPLPRILSQLRLQDAPIAYFLPEELPFHYAPELLSSLFPSPVAGLNHSAPSDLSTVLTESCFAPTPSIDVFAFAVLMWRCLEMKAPSLPGVSTISDLHQAYATGTRLPRPAGASSSLKALFRNCFHADPTKRPSMASLLGLHHHSSQATLFDIRVDSLINDRVGRVFWKSHWLESDSVTWAQFFKAFTESFALPSFGDDTRMWYLKSLIARNSDVVTLPSFATFLQFFGPLPTWPRFYDYPPLIKSKSKLRALPLSPPTAIVEILERISGLLSQPWFHGDVSTLMAESNLRSQSHGAFLVRFSAKEPGCYTLSLHVREGKIFHLRIFHIPSRGFSINSTTFAPDIPALLEISKRELELRRPCPGSPFDDIHPTSHYAPIFPANQLESKSEAKSETHSD